MVQIIPQDPNPWGRFGAAIGQGLSESVPKEIDRYRLSSGLRDLSKNANSLSPLEAYSQAASIPGITPAMLQALPEIIRQQKMGQGLSNSANQRRNGQQGGGSGGQGNQQNPFQNQTSSEKNPTETSSVTTTKGVEATTKPYIPPTYDDILARAGELYQQNPQLYPTPESAMKGAVDEAQANQARNVALQNQRSGEQEVQSRVQKELSDQASRAEVKVPDEVYTDLENRAIEEVRSGQKTERQAAVDAKKELAEISRQYQDIDNLGTAKILTRSPSENKKSLRSIRDEFEKRNDLRNFASKLVATTNLSPSKAAYLTYPASKDVSKVLSGLKELKTTYDKTTTLPNIVDDETRDIATLNAAMKIAPTNAKKSLSQNDSLLAIAEELKSRGYNPNVWMDYVDKRKEKLNLSDLQLQELRKDRNFTNTLNDLWMFYFTGLDKLAEEK